MLTIFFNCKTLPDLSVDFLSTLLYSFLPDSGMTLDRLVENLGRGIENSFEKTEKIMIESKNFRLETSKEKDEGGPEKLAPVGYKRFLGLTLALCSSVAFSLAMLIVKLLTSHNPATIGVWRFSGIFLPSVPVLLFYRYGMNKPVFDPIWPIIQPAKFKMGLALLFRGITGTTGAVLQFYAVRYMELADSTVISFSCPVFVSLVARIFLGEKCGIVPVITALLTLFGVGIIARPPMLTGAQEFDEDNLIGTVLSFSAMLFGTIVFVMLRYLRELHFALVTSSFGLIGIVESAIVCIIVSRFDLPQSSWEWFLALSMVALTSIGQSFITLAFKFEQAGPVALVRTFDVVFAFIWQFIFIGVRPDIFSLLGSGIVVCGVVLIGVRKGLSTLPEDHPSRVKFWFLLK